MIAAWLRVSDVRHWTFCPRVLWHRLVMPHATHETPKMELGRRAEIALAKLERRRTVRAYGLDRAERRFGVALRSERLAVVGLCDLVLDVAGATRAWPEKVPDGVARVALAAPRRLIPVDMKRTEGGVSRHHVVQLAGYAMLLEEQEGLAPGSVDVGFVVLLPADDVQVVHLDAELRASFVRTLDTIREMMRTERFPPPTKHRAFCPECEYVNFCGDVL